MSQSIESLISNAVLQALTHFFATQNAQAPVAQAPAAPPAAAPAFTPPVAAPVVAAPSFTPPAAPALTVVPPPANPPEGCTIVDAASLTAYLQAAYQTLGPEKGAGIQAVLANCNLTALNEATPAHFSYIFACVEQLKARA